MEKIIRWITPRFLKFSIGLGCALFLLSVGGCVMPPVVPFTGDMLVERVDPIVILQRPLIRGVDDWHVDPGNLEWLDWNTGRDEFGNPTGVPNDGWYIKEVHVKCAVKTVEDTVYPTDDPNFWYWVPGWTGAIDPISGWPYANWPNIPYSIFDCQSGSHTVFPDGAPTQEAAIAALATTDRIHVRFILPEMGGGWYTVDEIPGFAPESDNEIEIWVGRSGDFTATWTDGIAIETWTITIPEDWFWIRWEGDIPVGPIGRC